MAARCRLKSSIRPGSKAVSRPSWRRKESSRPSSAFSLPTGRRKAASPSAAERHRLCAKATGPVQVWAALGTRSAVIFDLDNDGDLDIVTNEFNSEPLVLVSDLAQSKKPLNYLRIKLTGTRSNRGGIGAKVQVKAGEQVYTQVLDGKSGYLSQSLKPLYFGLGNATSVDEIRVQWPSGAKQAVSKPEINRLLEIRETE